MATELGTAYISVVGDTKQLAKDVKDALNGAGKDAEVAGRDIGKRLSATASRAMRDGWKPDKDIMAGLPDTKLDRMGARIGQVIGKGVVVGLRANEAGAKFAKGFSDGASSVGLGRLLAKWRAELAGGTALQSMGALAGKTFAVALTGAATVGVGALVGGIGLALTKGMDRLLTIDKAKFKLKGLGKSTSEIADIVKTVTDSVTGTPFSLDEAFATAVQSIGAGTKDLQRFMKDVVDAAGFAGTDISRMGLIFNQVLAKGKLTGEEMMQLMEAGLPAKSWIMDSYKLTSDQFDKMQEKGEVTMDMLQKSIEDHAGGMGKALGNSLSGAIDNLKTSVARIGADFLSAIFGGDSSKATDTMAENIQKITDKLNNLDTWVKSNAPSIQSTFKTIGQAIIDAFNGAKKAVDDFVSDMKLLATGLSKLFGGMASFDEFLNNIPGMGGNEQEAAKLRDLQKSLASWGDPNPAPTGGGGSNGPHGGLGERRRGATSGLPMPGQNPMSGSSPIAPTDTGGGADVTNSFGPPGGGGRGLIMGPVGSDPVERWRPMVRQTIAQYGAQYGITNPGAWESKMMTQIRTESGGNPSVFNNWDSNAAAGHPSRGLLQFIPSTFAAHNITGGDIMDPAAQMAAFIPYVMSRYGVDKNGSPLQVGRGVGYDSGGWLQPGTTVAVNQSGKPELILTNDQATQLMGAVDPNTIQHGTGNGAPPGPQVQGTPDQVKQANDSPFWEDLTRTIGYIPANAGNTGVAGTSSLAGYLNLGNEAVGGLIDTGASLAQMAVSAAITAGAAGGSFGAGAAAAPAASAAAGYGIQLAAAQGKRAAAYGFQMASILGDAAVEQLFPFGAPRWLGYDYTQFAPHLGIEQALTTTVEKAGGEAINKAFGLDANGNPVKSAGGPVQPQQMSGAPEAPMGPDGAGQPLPGGNVGNAAGQPLPKPPTDPFATNSAPNPGATINNAPVDPLKQMGIYDQGGVLEPGQLAFNASRVPEQVLTAKQWEMIASQPPGAGGSTYNVYAQNTDEAIRQLRRKERLDMMQYAGRP